MCNSSFDLVKKLTLDRIEALGVLQGHDTASQPGEELLYKKHFWVPAFFVFF